MYTFVIILAGHDGCVILWDLRNGNIITKFHNTVSAVLPNVDL